MELDDQQAFIGTLNVPISGTASKHGPHQSKASSSQRTSVCSTTSSIMPGGLRASIVSVRSSLQSSIRSVGILLIAPFSKHRCCLGCVSLRDAIPLICVAEIIMLSMAAVIVLDLYLGDGDLFYTHVLKGKGRSIGLSFIVVVLVTLIVMFLTLFAWRTGHPRFYLIHATWQMVILVFLGFVISQVLYGMRQSPPRILIASGCVVTVFLSIVIFLQLWWLFVIVDAAFFQSYYYRRSSWRDDEETNGQPYSNTSKKQNVILPVVKVDCVSE